jgi:hypothetical protein
MTKPIPEWKRRNRELEERSRMVFRPRAKRGKGKAAGYEILALPSNRPGQLDYYIRVPSPPTVPTRPLRKVRFE